MRPGRNCERACRPSVPSRSAISAASRPAMRQAITAAAPMVGSGHTTGHTVRISRSAIAASNMRPSIHSTPASPAIDQTRPVRVVTGRRVDPSLVQVVPALARDEVAHLHQPHRVVVVEQRLRGAGPMLGDKLQHRQQPGEGEQQGKIRLMDRRVSTRQEMKERNCVRLKGATTRRPFPPFLDRQFEAYRLLTEAKLLRRIAWEIEASDFGELLHGPDCSSWC